MKLGIIADVEGWAIWSHAQGLRRYAPTGVDAEVRVIATADPAWIGSNDVTYSMYLGGVNFNSRAKRYVACVGSHCWMHSVFDPTNWRTRGVNYTRSHQNGTGILRKLDAVVCRNNALGRWASALNSSVRVFPGGVDTAIYNPRGRRNGHGKLRVGFCGQISDNPDADFKGYRELWLPLVERLSHRYEFTANTETHATRKSQDQMVEWFRSLDVFLCCSCADATPIPPFQAAACGAVVVSTDVGQITDWTALRQLGLIVPDYGNHSEAEKAINAIAMRLGTLEDASVRRNAQQALLASIESEYSYRVLGPKTLRFVCGVA